MIKEAGWGEQIREVLEIYFNYWKYTHFLALTLHTKPPLATIIKYFQKRVLGLLSLKSKHKFLFVFV